MEEALLGWEQGTTFVSSTKVMNRELMDFLTLVDFRFTKLMQWSSTWEFPLIQQTRMLAALWDPAVEPTGCKLSYSARSKQKHQKWDTVLRDNQKRVFACPPGTKLPQENVPTRMSSRERCLSSQAIWGQPHWQGCFVKIHRWLFQAEQSLRSVHQPSPCDCCMKWQYHPFPSLGNNEFFIGCTQSNSNDNQPLLPESQAEKNGHRIHSDSVEMHLFAWSASFFALSFLFQSLKTGYISPLIEDKSSEEFNIRAKLSLWIDVPNLFTYLMAIGASGIAYFQQFNSNTGFFGKSSNIMSQFIRDTIFWQILRMCFEKWQFFHIADQNLRLASVVHANGVLFNSPPHTQEGGASNLAQWKAAKWTTGTNPDLHLFRSQVTRVCSEVDANEQWHLDKICNSLEDYRLVQDFFFLCLLQTPWSY